MTALSDLVDQPSPRPGFGRVGVGTANGSFGELLQGGLPGPGAAEGEGRFLVTLPVARWSSARLELTLPDQGLTVRPVHKTKAAALAAALLAELGHPVHGSLVLHSSIPEGKGLASSSADLVATARAVSAAVRRTLAPPRLGAILAGIEPTDGVMYTAPGYAPPERRRYAQLLADLGCAVDRGDLAAVGAISTESAALNQGRMPNRNFGALRGICRSVGGLGLVACHSGTMVGILLDPRRPGYQAQLWQTVHHTEHLPGRTHLYRTLAV